MKEIQVYESEFGYHAAKEAREYKCYSFAEYMRDCYWLDKKLKDIWEEAASPEMKATNSVVNSSFPVGR